MLKIFLLLVLSCVAAHRVPNIMFILMDDLGWGDISATGGQFPTPAIDELYSKSVQLNRHYIHLMCSPSRSQFITGRYAMHMGFGKMLPWDYTEIGGIPIGQPTIANWLRDYGNYDTYAVGYAYHGMTPLQRGFDHFYGFYQGAIHYDTKKYIDIRFGDSDHYDFWEDGKPAIKETNTTTNTMYYYRDKVIQYLQKYGSNYKVSGKRSTNPFYMYLPLQTIHGPLSDVQEYAEKCAVILRHKMTQQQKYCMNTLLADKVVGSIIDELINLELYDNTLIVFTTDNGADISNKGCNYPLRGTKGTMFDGNQRTISLVSGGIIPVSQHNTIRTSLFSSLDWTPTLLQFSGLIADISHDDITWDGINQYSLIMHGDNAVADDKKRSEIILNIGLKSLESASIVFEYKNSLYKYFAKDEKIDGWAYRRTDGWCNPLPVNDISTYLKWNVIYDNEETMPAAQECSSKYLFDLIADEREMQNMLFLSECKTGINVESENEIEQSENDIDSIVNYARSIMNSYLVNDDLYSEHISCLWTRLPSGLPSNLGNNSFIRPFLSKTAYFEHLETCFENEEKKGNVITDELRLLYFNEWIPPQHQQLTIASMFGENKVGKEIDFVLNGNNGANSRIIQIFMLLSFMLILMLLVLYYSYRGLYCPIKSNIEQLRNESNENVSQSLLETMALSDFYDIAERVNIQQYEGYGTLLSI